MFRRIALTATLALLGTVAPAAGAPIAPPSQVADELSTPWEMLETDPGRVLITEFPGSIRAINNGTLNTTPLYQNPAAEKFLGLARAPDYLTATTKHVFLYETLKTGTSRVVRLVDKGTSLDTPTVIFDGIDSDLKHDGGRIAFGPDDQLYVTTGDIHDKDRPRDIDNLNGKILRMTAAGEPVADNPFNNNDGVKSARDFVWSYGHRHPQGLAWDAQDRLWETEHGPSGEGPTIATRRGHDELNLIEPGKDYGWPVVAGDLQCSDAPTVRPVVHSGPPNPTAWAMADLAYSTTDGYLYAPALAGQHLHVFDTHGDTTVDQHAALTFSPRERLRSATLISPTEMWIATHDIGDPDRIFELEIADGDTGIPWQSFTPAAPQFVTCSGGDDDDPPATTITTPTTPVAPVSPGVGTLPPPEQAVSPATRAATLATRLRSALRRTGLRGLLRRGSVGVRAGGFDAGSRVLVQLQLRRTGRPALTVATARMTPRSRSQVTFRVRLTRRGRATLRRTRSARLTVRVTHTPAGGTPVKRTALLTLRR